MAHTRRKQHTTPDVALEDQLPNDVGANLATSLLTQITDGVESAAAESDISPMRVIKQAFSTAETTEKQECITASIVSSWRTEIDDERQWESVKYLTPLGSGKRLTGGVRSEIGVACGVAQLVESGQPVVSTLARDPSSSGQTSAERFARSSDTSARPSTCILCRQPFRSERWLAHTHNDVTPRRADRMTNARVGRYRFSGEVVARRYDRREPVVYVRDRRGQPRAVRPRRERHTLVKIGGRQ